MTEPKWKRFEELAAHIQQSLAPGASIARNEKLRGQDSGVDREIDLLIRARVGQFDLTIVIDCKDYKKPVDVKDLEAFIGLVRDVRANRGAMVSARGFSGAAKRRAAAVGIDVFTLVDAKSTEWGAYVAIPVLVKDSSLRGYAFSLELLDPVPISGDVTEISVYRADGSRIGPVKDLLFALWNEGGVPAETGEHRDLQLCDEPVFLHIDGKRARVRLLGHAHVERTCYFGHLRLIDVQGFMGLIRLRRHPTRGGYDGTDGRRNEEAQAA